MILERLVVAVDADLKGLRDITAGAARMERDVQRNMTRAGQAADRFADRMESAGTKLTLGPTLAIGVLGGASLIAAGKMDQLRRGLDSVTGSSLETERQLRRLREVSKLPGLGFEEAIQGSINLQAAGFSAGLSERALRGFGNALASVGKGRAELDGVIMALGQIASKGKISAEEINQIAERVPQIRKVMEAAFGTANTEQLQKMQIDAVTFVDRVVAELEKLPPVTTGIANSYENVTDQSKNTAAAWGNRLVPAASGLMDVSSDLLTVLEDMPPVLKDIGIGAGVAVAALGPLTLGAVGLIRLGPLLAASWASLVAVGGPILGVAAAMGAVTAAGLAVANNWRVLRYEASQLGSTIKGKLGGALEWLNQGRIADGGPGWARARELAKYAPLPEIGIGTYSTSSRNQMAVMSGKMDEMAAFRAYLKDFSVGGWDAAGFQATARSVEALTDRQRDLREEAEKLDIDLALAKGTDAAEKLEEKLADVREELRRVTVLLGGESAQMWSKLQSFIDNTELTGPHSSLLDGRGFKMPTAASTSWKIVLDPQTGLPAWKRITEGGIKVNVPGVNPLTGAPTGTGAAAANWTDDLKGWLEGVGQMGSQLLDPKVIASNLATQGINAVSGWVFGQIGSMLFGGQDRDSIMRQQVALLRVNNERMDQLRLGLADFDRALLSEQGGTITGVAKAIGLWTDPTHGGMTPPGGGSFEDWLASFGTTIEDVDRLAGQFGITIRGANGHLIVSGLQQLAEMLNSDFLRQLTSTFDGGFSLLRQELDLLDITDPMEQFQRSIDFISTLVRDDLAAQLQALGPGSIDDFITDVLARLRAGDTSFLDQLGNVSVSQFLDWLGMAEGALDRLGESADSVSGALRNLPTGFKINLARFRADAGVDGLPVTPPTIGGGGGGFEPALARAVAGMVSAPQWTFTGPIYVTANDPEELVEKLEGQVQWRQRTGAYVIPTTTRRGG